MIIISLFDEVEFDDRGSGGYLDDENSIRVEKHFLGSAVLPFQVRASRLKLEEFFQDARNTTVCYKVQLDAQLFSKKTVSFSAIIYQKPRAKHPLVMHHLTFQDNRRMCGLRLQQICKQRVQ